MPTKRSKPQVNTADLELEMQDYLQNRSTRERAEWREKTAKDKFMGLLAEVGEPGPTGHRSLSLNEPLEYGHYKGGKLYKKSIIGIRRTRRSSQVLDTDKAMALIKDKGLHDCTETVTEVRINEDALLAAIFEGRITDDEAKTLYNESESFAFNLIEAGEADDE